MGFVDWLKKTVSPSRQAALVELFRKNQEKLEAARKKPLLKNQKLLADFSSDLNSKFIQIAEKRAEGAYLTREDISNIEILINDIQRYCGKLVKSWDLEHDLENIKIAARSRKTASTMYRSFQRYANKLLSKIG